MSNMIVSQATALAKKLTLDANPEELVVVLKATAFKGQVSDAQMAALMMVARHVSISETECWEWDSSLNTGGYGQLTYKGRHYTAHRFAFSMLVGLIKKGMWVLHHCDNRRCVNPAHLYQGTAVNNRQDMLNRNRWQHPWGQRTHCKQGHEYEVVGYRIDKNDGSRVCRACQRNYKREQRAAKKAA